MQRKIIVSLSMAVFYSQLLSGCAALHFEEIKTLREMGRDEKAKEEVLAQENRSFQNMEAAIRRQSLKAGISGAEIAGKFGSPVTAIPEENAGEKWVYKGETASGFGGPKIYLFFDENNRLKQWQCVRMVCDIHH